MNESGDFSDELDEFEESMEEKKINKPAYKNSTSFTNKPYDEVIEVSQDLSMAESFDPTHKQQNYEKEKKLRNDRYDEAVEVSQSLDQVNMSAAMKQPVNSQGFGAKGGPPNNDYKGSAGGDSKAGPGQQPGMLNKNNEQSRSQTVLNKPFDEALEFSQSGSEESMDTARDKKRQQIAQKANDLAGYGEKASNLSNKANPSNSNNNSSNNIATQQQIQQQIAQQQQAQKRQQQAQLAHDSPKKSEDGESSEEEENEHEESYEHIEGAYNPKDYLNLNVSAEVRDLFQYIERYKPQEVELDTPLKCFIPEFIPAIGELDAFIKIPRPDKKEDGSGLRYIDEPANNQSDPTVLELQLRAKSKKLQYGDVVVRSIENADKNPAKIEKWIQDINDLHRSKPPPQVNYKKNMPDIDRLMEAWPEEFESLLASTPLPSPDLEMSIGEYAKALCSILDIPVYDNPIESLHLMFSLYIEFKNNPHFQSRLPENQADAKNPSGGNGGGNQGAKYGNADVLEISNDYK